MDVGSNMGLWGAGRGLKRRGALVGSILSQDVNVRLRVATTKNTIKNHRETQKQSFFENLQNAKNNQFYNLLVQSCV